MLIELSAHWLTLFVFFRDQLRQRVAWSLAQQLVVVPENIVDDKRTEIYNNYYDIFVRNAFGNYRDILREISYSPLMGETLSYQNSKSHRYIYQKENKQIARADENFA